MVEPQIEQEDQNSKPHFLTADKRRFTQMKEKEVILG